MKSKFAKILSLALALSMGLTFTSFAQQSQSLKIEDTVKVQNTNTDKVQDVNTATQIPFNEQDKHIENDEDEPTASLGVKVFAKKIGETKVKVDQKEPQKPKNPNLQTVNNYFIGTFRLYDPKTGKVYDFSAKKAFTYDYKQKTPPLKVDKWSFDVFTKEIEKFYSDGKEKTIQKAVKVADKKNKYEIKTVKVNAREIDKKSFEKEMSRRIKVADYSLFKIPFIDKKEEYVNDEEVVLLSRYSSKYNLGDPGRSNNIQVAGEEINGTKLNPGEKFYFNLRTEPVNGKLQNAYIIQNNEFVLGIGGGLCQVSTTLFNTALESGLQIDHRRNHSLQVHYVPYGRDAMVSNSNDFVFSNNFKHPIYIMYQRPTPNEIQFEIYGNKSDKKQVKTWTTGGGKSYALHRVIDNSKAQESFYSNYQ